MPGHSQPSLRSSPFLRILTLCSLYVSQGLPQGFIHYALKNHLADRTWKALNPAETLSRDQLGRHLDLPPTTPQNRVVVHWRQNPPE